MGPSSWARRPEGTSYWKVSCRRATACPREKSFSLARNLKTLTCDHHKRRSTKNFLKYYNRARAVIRSVL